MNAVDQKIVTYLQSHNEEGMQLIFQYHYQDICNTIHSVVKRTDVVEDLAQDMLIRFWNKRNTLTIRSSLRSYLKTMAVREGIGHLRKQKEIPSDFPPNQVVRPEQTLEAKETQERIMHAIDELPDRCKEVFRLSREKSLTYNEIATKLDISPKTVENQMSKALKLLRQRLKEVMYVTFF